MYRNFPQQLRDLPCLRSRDAPSPIISMLGHQCAGVGPFDFFFHWAGGQFARGSTLTKTGEGAAEDDNRNEARRHRKRFDFIVHVRSHGLPSDGLQWRRIFHVNKLTRWHWLEMECWRRIDYVNSFGKRFVWATLHPDGTQASGRPCE